VAVLAVLASAGLAAPTALAADITLHWVILKCQFSDDTTHDVPGSPTNSDAQIADFLVNRGTDGIPDYVDDLSQGHLAVTGTISGWYTMPTTLAADPTIDSDRRVQDCIDTAQRAGWARPAGEPVVVFRNECTARGTNASTWVLMDPCSTFTQTARDLLLVGGAHASGDDPWSVTSTSTVFTQPSRWGPKPVGYNGYQLGFIPKEQWPTHTSGQITLAPLYGSNGTGLPRVVILPWIEGPNPTNIYHLIVEYRYPQGLDAGIGGPIVLVHRMTYGYTEVMRGSDGRPAQDVVVANQHVHVLSSGGPTATVSIDTGYGLPRVPDVMGLPRADAGRTVQAAGLAVSFNASLEPTCDHLGQIVAQVPDAGTVVSAGSRVILTVATKPAKACP